MLSSQDWGSSIVSLVGKAVAYDGQERVTFECADGVTVQLTVGGGEFDYVQGKPIEVMGAVSDDKSVQVSLLTLLTTWYHARLDMGESTFQI